MIKSFSVTAYGDHNYPVKTVRVTLEQAGFEENGFDLEKAAQTVRKAGWGNPELGIAGLLQAVFHHGMKDVLKQINDEKLKTFMKNRRG